MCFYYISPSPVCPEKFSAFRPYVAKQPVFQCNICFRKADFYDILSVPVTVRVSNLPKKVQHPLLLGKFCFYLHIPNIMQGFWINLMNIHSPHGLKIPLRGQRLLHSMHLLSSNFRSVKNYCIGNLAVLLFLVHFHHMIAPTV